MDINKIIWLVWWVGTFLIAGSWFNIVPYKIGWVGFGMACTASLISVVLNRYWRVPSKSEDLDRGAESNQEKPEV